MIVLSKHYVCVLERTFFILKGGKAMKTGNLPYKFIRKNADTLTPIGIFKRLTGKQKFLLESSFEHEKKGKYSYIGSDPYLEIIGYDNVTKIVNHETRSEEHTSELQSRGHLVCR